VDFAAVARGFGWTAFSVADPHQVESVLKDALATAGPVLVQVDIDQNDPLLPPKIKAKQAFNMAKALLKGTPGGGEIFKDILKDAAREVV
jgi:pyruvate dehydrogenase (quinone)